MDQKSNNWDIVCFTVCASLAILSVFWFRPNFQSEGQAANDKAITMSGRLERMYWELDAISEQSLEILDMADATGKRVALLENVMLVSAPSEISEEYFRIVDDSRLRWSVYWYDTPGVQWTLAPTNEFNLDEVKLTWVLQDTSIVYGYATGTYDVHTGRIRDIEVHELKVPGWLEMTVEGNTEGPE